MSEVVVVTVASFTDDYDYTTSDVLLIDGKKKFSVSPLSECPEDAIIGRDLISSDDIASFLKDFLIKNNGKQVKFEFVECKSPDEFDEYQYAGVGK